MAWPSGQRPASLRGRPVSRRLHAAGSQPEARRNGDLRLPVLPALRRCARASLARERLAPPPAACPAARGPAPRACRGNSFPFLLNPWPGPRCRARCLLHSIDLVGDQAMGLVVDGLGRRDGRRVDQAEHLASPLIDPVPQVPGLVLALRRRSARCASAMSSAATPWSNEWMSMKSGTAPPSVWLSSQARTYGGRPARRIGSGCLVSPPSSPDFPPRSPRLNFLPGSGRYAWLLTKS